MANWRGGVRGPACIAHCGHEGQGQRKRFAFENALPREGGLGATERKSRRTINEMTEPLFVRIEGNVVNLSSVIDWHPGGSHVLTSNCGQDVTDLFKAFHVNVSYRNLIVQPVTRTVGSVAPHVEDFRKLNDLFRAQGWYNPPRSIFAMHIFACLCLIATSACMGACSHVAASAVAMGMFWQQSSGLGHDLGHSSSLQKRKTNMLFGSVMSIFTGLSSVWWRHSHFQHHVHTNVKEEDPDILHLPIFSVSDKLLVPFYHNFIGTHVRIDDIAKILIRVQHVTMYPILMFARFNLYIQSVKHIWNKSDAYSRVEKMGIFCFFGWHVALFVRIGATRFFEFVLLSHFISGILHVQIVISHWASAVKSTSDTPSDHFSHTLQTTTDVTCPEYMDWFHMGLQFQVAHHMFPRLPRCHLRKATCAVQRICLKHNLVYNSMTFIDLNRHLLRHMKTVDLQSHTVKRERPQ